MLSKHTFNRWNHTWDKSLLMWIWDTQQRGTLLFAAGVSLRPSQYRLHVELVICSRCQVFYPFAGGCSETERMEIEMPGSLITLAQFHTMKSRCSLTSSWTISPLFIFKSRSNCTPGTLCWRVIGGAVPKPSVLVKEWKRAGFSKCISF